MNNPVPETSKGSGSIEDTLLLLDMLKEKNLREQKASKVHC